MKLAIPESIYGAFTCAKATGSWGRFKKQHYIAVEHHGPLRFGIAKLVPLLHAMLQLGLLR